MPSPISLEGMKFWVSQHVPKTVRSDIRKHHGEIVQLERNANVIIADPRQYVNDPSKSYSYEWIQECLRTNQRLDEAPYLISTIRENAQRAGAAAASTAAPPSQQAAAPPPSQQAASHGATTTSPSSYAASVAAAKNKRVRTRFTAEDDRILFEWIRRESKKPGERKSAMGNRLYIDLAAEHPHHTYHSWRDRFVKKLQFEASSSPLLDPAYQEPAPAAPAAPAAPPSPAPAPPAPPASRAAASASHRSPPPPSQPSQAAPPVEEAEPAEDRPAEPGQASGAPPTQTSLQNESSEPICFLAKNDLVLFRALFREATSSEKKTLDVFLRALATKYPSVPLQAWTERYNRLRDWYKMIDVYDQQPMPQPSRHQAHVHFLDQDSEQPPKNADSASTAAAAAATAASATEAAVANTQPTTPESQKRQTTETGSRSGSSQLRDSKDEGREINREDNEEEDEEDEEGGDVFFDAETLLNEVAAQDESKRQFYEDVEGVEDLTNKSFLRQVVLDGIRLDIWTLWATIQNTSPDPATRNWDQVVKALCLDVARHPNATKDLARWYDKNMKSLEMAILFLRSQRETDEADEEAEEEAHEQEDVEEERVEIEAAPYISPAAKRHLQRAFGDSDDEDSNERRSHSEQAETRSSSRAHKRARRDLETGTSDPPGSTSTDPPPFEPPRTLEPETQDFAMDLETQHADDAPQNSRRRTRHAASVENTPSQQLRTEEHVVQAVPLSLPYKRPVRSLHRNERQSLPSILDRARESPLQ